MRIGVFLVRVGGALAFAAATGMAFVGARAEPTDPRPNIVVIMADDLDVGSVERLLALGMMPHLKRYLIDEGVTFKNSFVTNSLCCPSRATFLTGQYAHNTGVLTNIPPTGSITAFNDSQTLATWLQAAGYRTSHIGKYLNGYGTADHNGDGMLDERDLHYIPPGWTDWQGLLDTGLSTYRVYNYWINDNGTLVQHGDAPEDYQTDVLAQRAARLIEGAEQTDDVPFFLVVTPIAPHVEIFPGITKFAPYPEVWKWDIRPAPRHEGTVNLAVPIPPSFNEADMSDKPAWLQPGQPRYRPPLTWADYFFLNRQYRHRLESLRAVDDLIGRVVAALRATGELENTVILFTSDNGFLHGEHRMAEKLVAYEESIRVPLYARIPGVAGGMTIEQLVTNNDLAPTIAELAGATPDLIVDGASFVPLLNGQSAWRKRFLVEHWDGPTGSVLDLPTYGAVRSLWASPNGPVNVLYLEYDNPDKDGNFNTPELYDIDRDPYQLDSLHASTNPLRIVQRMTLSMLLAALKSCAGVSCRVLEFCGAPGETCP